MIDHIYVFSNSIIILIISIIIGSIEIKRYYKEDRELRRTNDMNISYIHMLSTTGTICIMAAIASLTVLIVTGLDYYKIINF